MKLVTPILSLLLSTICGFAHSDQTSFHQAPAQDAQMRNPYKSGDTIAARAGAALFATHCASCHGQNAMGSGNVPALARGPAQSATDGELFWFIGKGSPKDGMSASLLPAKERWQLVSFIKSLASAPVANEPVASAPDTSGFPTPHAPFTDYRFESPGQVHKILPQDLPPPSPETSVGNSPNVVPRPKDAWPKVPAGFQVQLFASDLEKPRLMRTAPNGDIFLAESDSGKIKVLRGITADGRAEKIEVYASGLTRPYGIAFYPRGPNPKWVYIGSIYSIFRYPYSSGDLHARGPAQKIADLPGSARGHWTRDLTFSLDNQKLFVAVGSGSNIDDPDTTPAEKDRADILVMTPEGANPRVYASGIRNAGGGLAIHPKSGELWCSVNERDALGDNLVPDYITHVREGGFYGWPWWYIGGNQDPRYAGKHPELKRSLIEPDVLLQPHHASLELVFYDGKMFPKEFYGDIFSSQHGSWNRSVRTGYEVIRVPLHHTTKATGEYEDFMTGFVVDSGHVWGRPVGVTVAQDGSLLVSDDGSNSIWRVTYAPK